MQIQYWKPSITQHPCSGPNTDGWKKPVKGVLVVGEEHIMSATLFGPELESHLQKTRRGSPNGSRPSTMQLYHYINHLYRCNFKNQKGNSKIHHDLGCLYYVQHNNSILQLACAAAIRKIILHKLLTQSQQCLCPGFALVCYLGWGGPRKNFTKEEKEQRNWFSNKTI